MSQTERGTNVAAVSSDRPLEVERRRSEPTEPPATPKESAKSKSDGRSAAQRLLQRYVELYNAGDLDGVMDLYADDAVQLMPEGTFEGRTAIGERLAWELAAFPDLEWGLISFVEQGDAFADEWTFAGTHTGPLRLPDGTELPPTGKRVELRGMEWVLLSDGKIVVDNLYYDNLSVVTQLGLVPPAAPTGAA